MKKILLTCVLLLLASTTNGQRIGGQFILDSSTEINSFMVVNNAEGKPFSIKNTSPTKDKLGSISEVKYKLIGPNLLIDAKTNKASFGNLNYAISATITGPLGKPHKLDVAVLPAGRHGALVWEDALEKGWYPEGSYAVTMDLYLLGDLDCAMDRPRFELKGWKLLSTITTVVGAGLFGAGRLKITDSKTRYQIYLTDWAEGQSLTTGTRETYDQAIEARDEGRLLTEVGIAATVVGGVSAILQLLQTGKQKRMYDAYCTPSGEVRGVNIEAFGYGNAGEVVPGITLNYQF